MAPRYTWLWVILALGLFAFIFFFERHWQPEEAGPLFVLPGLNSAEVTTVQVRPAGQLEIRAERSNGLWRLTRPLNYPAEARRIESLLTNLAQLQVQTHISAAELRQYTNAAEEFGLDVPQASLLIQDKNSRHQVLVGARTPPGDQVFVQVVGIEGLYVVSAELLQQIPQSAAVWRDTRFAPLEDVVFDRITVTNAGVAFALQRDATRQSWRLTEPLKVRANTTRVEEALRALGHLRVWQFLTDDANADAESYGLQPPELSLTLANATQAVVHLAFGRSPTNDPRQVFARQLGQPAIVSVARELLAPWRVPYSEFRDRHLLTLSRPVQSIEVAGAESFTLQCLTSNTWRVLPLDLPADPDLAADLVSVLGNLQVTQFVKDVVIEPDLPQYGLATPVYKVIVRSATPAAGGTNSLLGELHFGNSQDGQTFVRRPDESSVYAVRTADFQRLPTAAFQLRDRRIWNLKEDDVARLTIHQAGKKRQLVRRGTNSWTLAAGSQGLINNFAVEEAVHRLCTLYAINWVACGEQDPARWGLTPENWQGTLELKSGDSLSLQLGGTSPSRLTYAATTLAGQVWVFECPPAVSELVRMALFIPPDAP